MDDNIADFADQIIVDPILLDTHHVFLGLPKTDLDNSVRMATYEQRRLDKSFSARNLVCNLQHPAT
jgi:hypothetical protein